ncbi:hypothetical protein N7448_006867 [Penicillium atrosanguineum]|uniref:Uncharacterized protein n=1 Tax=Penicillium atrosanguineum TaxID=1132637 RepID=A0A9W9L2Z4_9EURO|nr:uncharacterized protein N7443_010630 [Penicillium atrosanguineum]KAJ5132709.1 hypothetical protein N7448_006867 [Penicillium atrosanguineum]KAJ5141401.1 hypothetical protein N7526_002396 [Penicillium atrosanguineum]KAJ5290377.1 hypothetical protein N7443_010630 [Penicillium atrosanguineum]KAJ5308199.1 hypothetical protein N7476_008855 [Penicillium atrosanguineum]
MMHQIWLLVNETIINTQHYIQKQNLTEMDAVISCDHFRKLLNFNHDNPENIEFWLLSESVHHAERVKNDQELYLLWKTHCQDDHEITIIARPKSDSSSTPSNESGALCIFVERLKTWGHIWNSSGLIPPERAGYLHWIAKAHPSFANNALVFVQDLLLSSSPWATADKRRITRTRLVSVDRPFYLGRPYFSDEVAAKILNMPVEEYLLSDILNVLDKQYRYDRRPCILEETRTLLPFLLYAFGWTLKWVAHVVDKLGLIDIPVLKVPEMKTKLIAKPQQEKKENQGIVVVLRKTASQFIKSPDIPWLPVAKVEPVMKPKRNFSFKGDIKGKSRVASIEPDNKWY